MAHTFSFPRAATHAGAWPALAAIVTACNGSVTTVPGGSGGGAHTGGGGTGGGGNPPACTSLVQTGDLVRLPPIAGSIAWQPRLEALGDGQMAVVVTVAIPGMGPVELGATSIAWTKEWPPPATAPFALTDRVGYASPVGRAAPQGIPILGPLGAGAGLVFGFADPQKGGFTEMLLADPDASNPTFIATGAGGRFFLGMEGYSMPGTYLRPLHVGWVATAGTKSYVGPFDLGCPADPPSAQAVATQGGWLLARTVAETDCTTGPLDTVRVTQLADGQSQPGMETELTGAAALGLLPHPAGAWLIYAQSSQDGIWAARFDALAQIAVPPRLVSPPFTASFPLAADALDDGFVVAVSDDVASPPSSVTLLVTGADGAKIASASLAGVPVSSATPQLAFDPATRQVLVVLSMPDDSGPYDAIHVARFSCQ